MSNILTQIFSKLINQEESIPEESTICKHWKSTAVFTGAWDPGAGKKVPESELLLGELSAGIYQVGCYTVRSAVRVYKIREGGYIPELEVPALPEEMEMVKKEFDELKEMQDDTGKMGLPFLTFFWPFKEWSEKLRITHEISARHKSDTKGSFTYITRAAQAVSFRWSESIRHICTAKENLLTDDKDASLFVCNSYMGDSFGADTWYKLSPTGGITKLQLHPFDSKQDKAEFQ